MSTISESIASYLSKQEDINEETTNNASVAFLDAYGCILGAASNEQVSSFALPFHFKNTSAHPLRILGELDSELDIARYLGTLVRWFDFNDTFLAKEWAHPSDNIGGVWSSVLKYNESPKFKDILTALTKAYEIQGSLALGTSLNQYGYDHVFYVKLATAAVSSSIQSNFSLDKISRSINNVLNDGLQLRTYRHEPHVGKRKSWAAGDATARGLWLAQISSHDDNIYNGVQDEPLWGFEKVFLQENKLVLGKTLDTWVINNVLYKVSFPAEFHGQSAVEAAISLHPIFQEKYDEIEKIVINTHEPALRIISKSGKLENESARDHCLEYMTSVALIDGVVTSYSYTDAYEKLEEVEDLRAKFQVIEDEEYTKMYYDIDKRYIPNKVYFQYKDGTFSQQKEVLCPIGHPSRRDEALPLLKDKFISNSSSFHSEEFSSKLWEKVLEGYFTDKPLKSFVEYVLDHE